MTRTFIALAKTATLLLVFMLLVSIGRASAQVSSPSPADKATGVSTTTALSWRADPRATRYDVYLGTTNPPPIAVKNVTATTYQPSPLAAGTTYYWRIDSKGAKNYSATGTVWSFTTATPPPPPPSAPAGASPPSGTTGVPITTALSWSASSNATSYDVAFGTTTPPPLVSAGQATTAYQPAAALSYSQTYYWAVTARGSGGTTTGPTWTFTTEAAPPSTARDRLRVMTWNIRSGTDASGAAAVDGQAALMADSGADVIALQEVTITQQYGDLTALYLQKLQALTGATWYELWAPDPRASTYTPTGNLLLSRIPILSSATTQFDAAPSDPTMLDAKQSAGAITIVVNQVPVTLITTELPSDPSSRQSQTTALLSWASAFQAPRLLGGDLNESPGGSNYASIAGAFTDVWPALAGTTEYGFTFDRPPGGALPARVDDWFEETTDTRARATEVWVVKTTRSNHHALVIDVSVR